MKAKNFRIGNFIELNGKLYEVENDSFSTDNIAGVSVLEFCEKIPLTDKWATFFGYECLVEMACDIAYQSKYRIEITSENLKKMKVDEIQNLFFALTGNELELKTEVSH